MKKKIISKIPEFKTVAEEAEFWDTHDITDFEDETENVHVVVRLKQPKDEILAVRMQKHVKERLRRLARHKGLDASSLARMWLMEKLQSSYGTSRFKKTASAVADKGKEKYAK